MRGDNSFIVFVTCHIRLTNLILQPLMSTLKLNLTNKCCFFCFVFCLFVFCLFVVGFFFVCFFLQLCYVIHYFKNFNVFFALCLLSGLFLYIDPRIRRTTWRSVPLSNPCLPVGPTRECNNKQFGE